MSDESRLEFVPLDLAVVPPNGLIEHLKDRWWAYCPERGLAFFKAGKHLAPQCNGNEHIARRLFKDSWPGLEVRFVPSVFRRIHPSDYA